MSRGQFMPSRSCETPRAPRLFLRCPPGLRIGKLNVSIKDSRADAIRSGRRHEIQWPVTRAIRTLKNPFHGKSDTRFIPYFIDDCITDRQRQLSNGRFESTPVFPCPNVAKSSTFALGDLTTHENVAVAECAPLYRLCQGLVRSAT